MYSDSTIVIAHPFSGGLVREERLPEGSHRVTRLQDSLMHVLAFLEFSLVCEYVLKRMSPFVQYQGLFSVYFVLEEVVVL